MNTGSAGAGPRHATPTRTADVLHQMRPAWHMPLPSSQSGPLVRCWIRHSPFPAFAQGAPTPPLPTGHGRTGRARVLRPIHYRVVLLTYTGKCPLRRMTLYVGVEVREWAHSNQAGGQLRHAEPIRTKLSDGPASLSSKALANCSAYILVVESRSIRCSPGRVGTQNCTCPIAQYLPHNRAYNL